MIKLAVNGALGRMGSRILELARKSSENFKIAAAFDENSGDKISKLSAARLKGSDVLIDFSSPEGTRAALEAALQTNAAMVIGTTGADNKLQADIREASKKIPIVFSPNMSIGANFLFELSRLSASKLKEGYDIEIIEQHHRLKKDAPSGTAKKIAEVISKEKGWNLGKVVIHSVRAGDIVGEHTVIFSGPGETIELTHRAQSRDAFARGALVAALFAAKKKSGLYSMLDVLNF